MTRAELMVALEAAEGPSRELDRDIHGIAFPHDDIDGPEGDPVYREIEHVVWFNVPAYTESIDAALSFTPEGEWITLEIRPKKAHCEFTDRADVDVRNCANPAIALCIANLKALEAQEEV